MGPPPTLFRSPYRGCSTLRRPYGPSDQIYGTRFARRLFEDEVCDASFEVPVDYRKIDEIKKGRLVPDISLHNRALSGVAAGQPLASFRSLSKEHPREGRPLERLRLLMRSGVHEAGAYESWCLCGKPKGAERD
jgi:hypothetical protein